MMTDYPPDWVSTLCWQKNSQQLQSWLWQWYGGLPPSSNRYICDRITVRRVTKHNRCLETPAACPPVRFKYPRSQNRPGTLNLELPEDSDANPGVLSCPTGIWEDTKVVHHLPRKLLQVTCICLTFAGEKVQFHFQFQFQQMPMNHHPSSVYLCPSTASLWQFERSMSQRSGWQQEPPPVAYRPQSKPLESCLRIKGLTSLF